jgi:purine nucleoside phosphorylase
MATHRIGIIGGSGLYHIEGFTNQKWVKVKTPFGPPSDALLTGTLAGREVVFLPRHARGHRLLPSELNHRANIWALKKLGVAWIISVSAVGSLQKKYRPATSCWWTSFSTGPSAILNTRISGAASWDTWRLRIRFARNCAACCSSPPGP